MNTGGIPRPTFFGQLRNAAFALLPPQWHWPLHAMKYYWFTAASEKDFWRQRTALVSESADSARIPRHPDAGEIRGGFQTMHNGLRVVAGSYFGLPGSALLRATRGIHEPQEEQAFGEILMTMREGAVMVELGAYWAYYSAWFAKVVKRPRCFLLEPDLRNLCMGKRNFSANGLSGQFFNYAIGEASSSAAGHVPIISIDDFRRQQGIDRIDLLHSDIQGWEQEMLKGACESLRQRAIGYAFISTHTETLHRACTEVFLSSGYQVVSSVTLKQSYSVDGLLIAKAPGIAGPDHLTVSLRPAQ